VTCGRFYFFEISAKWAAIYRFRTKARRKITASEIKSFFNTFVRDGWGEKKYLQSK
jgi:hypothetical protein